MILRQRCAGIDRVWDWLNGRRSAGEVWERLQLNDALPMDALLTYIELLMAEGCVESA